jgi:hypothetical protein
MQNSKEISAKRVRRELKNFMSRGEKYNFRKGGDEINIVFGPK